MPCTSSEPRETDDTRATPSPPMSSSDWHTEPVRPRCSSALSEAARVNKLLSTILNVVDDSSSPSQESVVVHFEVSHVAAAALGATIYKVISNFCFADLFLLAAIATVLHSIVTYIPALLVIRLWTGHLGSCLKKGDDGGTMVLKASSVLKSSTVAESKTLRRRQAKEAPLKANEEVISGMEVKKKPQLDSEVESSAEENEKHHHYHHRMAHREPVRGSVVLGNKVLTRSSQMKYLEQEYLQRLQG